MAKTRMQDIARMAGVSLATVSRVIHSPQLVSPETREMVNHLIQEKNYIYNAAAGDLSRKISKVIGVLIPTTRSPAFATTILSIQEKCQEKGYSVILGNTKYDGREENRLLKQFHERQAAGVILTGFTLGQEQAVWELVRSGTPCVVIWEKLIDDRISYVGFDNFQASRSMTRYLLDLGHRRIGLIIGPYSKVGRVRKRLDGYLSALSEAGVRKNMNLVVETEPALQSGREAMLRLLAGRNRPTAVFAASDVLAIGAVKAAREKGLAVPMDISVAGFDDIGFAAYCEPPLTTVRVPTDQIGNLAVEVLLEAIEGGCSRIRQHCMDTEIVVRDSCGPPAANG